MANKRLFLVHRPSGHAVYLGKRLGWGWSVSSHVGHDIQTLFDLIESQKAGGDQDDFVIDANDGNGKEYTVVGREERSAADRLLAAETRLNQWRLWAQFVWRGGGAPTGTDEQLRASVCEIQDGAIKEVIGRLEAAETELALLRQLRFPQVGDGQ